MSAPRATASPQRRNPSRLVRRLRPWVPVLRLARRDAARHRVRTLLSVLLVAVPVAALVGAAGLTQTVVPARETALASIPDGAQAVITTTALPRDEMPFPQLPEGAPGPWVDDLDQVPATGDELAALVPGAAQLRQYWNSPALIATVDLDLAPGEQAPAGTGVTAVESRDVGLVSSTTLQEAVPEALDLLLPDLTAGAAPTTAAETVITTALADRLDITIDDTIAFVAPPSTGWFSSDGRIGEAIQDSQRAYQVTGLVDDTTERAWALADWMSAMVTADPAGVDGHWLVVGKQPLTWADAKQLNSLQAFAVSRHVLTNYPTPNELYPVGVDVGALLTRLAMVVLVGTVGSVLVLFLVTPAFTVAAEQSRRTLGLAAATGATPRDLRRSMTAQGLVVGLAGGSLGAVIGTVFGILTAPRAMPRVDVLANFPWWSLPVAVAIAVLLGVIATLMPAYSAARLQPIEALKDRPTRSDSHSSAATRTVRHHLAGPVLLAVAVGCAVLSLILPLPLVPEPGPNFDPSSAGAPVWLAAPMMLAMVSAIVGLVLSVRALTEVGVQMARHLPAASRLALRDAADHRSRFVPAATGVLVAMLAASFMTVMIGSTVANDRNQTGEMVTGGRIVLGAEVPVSDDFDRLALIDAIDVLAANLPATGHEPVFAVPSNNPVNLGPLPPADRRCPTDLYPDTASSVQVGAPLTCVDWDHSYSPGLALPWSLGSSVHVMGGDALRASGLAGAKEAAAVLDDGGAVVNSAAMLSHDTTVRVALSDQPLPTEADASTITELPGAFVRGFAPPLTVSPETARNLGIPAVSYVGEYVVTSRELTQGELDQAWKIIPEHTTLVSIATPQLPYPWGSMTLLVPIAALVALALAATTISLLLARTQTVRDLTTMHAVGAPPSFLRRFTTTQAGLVLTAGVPLGVLSGITLGVYLVAWNRRLGVSGAWLETAPLWGLQSMTVLAVIGVGLSTTILLSRPPSDLTQRATD